MSKKTKIAFTSLMVFMASLMIQIWFPVAYFWGAQIGLCVFVVGLYLTILMFIIRKKRKIEGAKK